MTQDPNRRPLKPLSSLQSQSGMTLFEAVLSIGFVAVVVLVNTMLMGQIFSQRDTAAHRHTFDENLEERITRVDTKAVCDTLFKSFGTSFMLENLSTERHITDLQEGSSSPILKVGRVDFGGQLIVTDMTLKLAHELKAGSPPADQYPPMAYFWLDITYEYHRENPVGVDTVQHKGVRRLLYEVSVSQKSYTEFSDGTVIVTGGGTFVKDSCVDFVAKYNQQAIKLMCFLLGIRPDAKGKCDLQQSDGIRETACRLTGYGYGGRYCDRDITL